MVARSLVEAFEYAVAGFAGSYGLSVMKGNTRAIAFYGKAGFQVTGQDARSLQLRKRLE